jgi:hypothetical protein
MNQDRISYTFLLVILMLTPVQGQEMWPGLPSGKDLNPSDITRPYNNIAIAGEFVDMVEGNLWKWNLQGGIALGQNRHGFSFKIPFVRSIYPDVEQLTGIGDISLRYQLVTYDSKMHVRTLASSALYLDLSIPTGDELKGHGAGVPILMPGFALAYRPVPQIAIYPHIRYLHSFGDVEGDWGGGYPGAIPGDPALENKKIRSFQIEGMFNYEFNRAWIGIAPAYIYSFSSKEGTLTIRPQIGKLFAEKISINLSSSFYIAGRRRLISWTYFDVRYYF